jgi:alkaline phosphatase D
MKGNRPPSEGFQFFGTLTISARTRTLIAGLHDLSGQQLYSQEIPAQR